MNDFPASKGIEMRSALGGAAPRNPVEMTLFGRLPPAGALGNARHDAATGTFDLVPERPKASLGQNPAKNLIESYRHPIDVKFFVIEHEASSARPH